MGKCPWSGWKWLRGIKEIASPFPCCLVNRECWWKKTKIQKTWTRINEEDWQLCCQYCFSKGIYLLVLMFLFNDSQMIWNKSDFHILSEFKSIHSPTCIENNRGLIFLDFTLVFGVQVPRCLWNLFTIFITYMRFVLFSIVCRILMVC